MKGYTHILIKNTNREGERRGALGTNHRVNVCIFMWYAIVIWMCCVFIDVIDSSLFYTLFCFFFASSLRVLGHWQQKKYHHVRNKTWLGKSDGSSTYLLSSFLLVKWMCIVRYDCFGPVAAFICSLVMLMLLLLLLRLYPFRRSQTTSYVI